jgi:hypothetical protein
VEETESQILERALEVLRTEQVEARTQGIAVPVLEQRIKTLLKKEPLLAQYRAVQTLHFTDLKAQIIEKIPEKLENASLKDLTSAFKTFHDAERDIEDPSRHVKGIVAYLIHIDEAEKKNANPLNFGDVIDIQSETTPANGTGRTSDGIKIPRL